MMIPIYSSRTYKDILVKNCNNENLGNVIKINTEDKILGVTQVGPWLTTLQATGRPFTSFDASQFLDLSIKMHLRAPWLKSLGNSCPFCCVEAHKKCMSRLIPCGFLYGDCCKATAHKFACHGPYLFSS